MTGTVVALSGGIGGAKLALGLRHVLPPGRLAVIANTGDDFVHLGLHVSADVDTLLYTLSGLADPARGWGRRDETWSFMGALRALGGEDWFQLGDQDLALHVLRTARLAAGETLSSVTAALAERMGTGAAIHPMADSPVRTRLLTDAGWLDFQDYFVRLQCRPVVSRIVFEGAESARVPPDLLRLLHGDVAAIVLCPSNPFISIDPILAVPGMREALRASGAPIVAVSPLIGGQAVKGPTAKMFDELGFGASSVAVANHYAGQADVLVVDPADAATAAPPGMRIAVEPTLMTDLAAREQLARAVLAIARNADVRGKQPGRSL